MTYLGQTTSLSSAVDTGHKSQSLLINSQLTSEVRKHWEQGEYADLATLLEKHPEIKHYRSFVLDLAHQEYTRRLANGESLDADEFSRQFPSYQKSLYFLIEVHKLIDHDPNFRIIQDNVSWPKHAEEFLGFYILSELGRGTFARVYLASESALGGRMVALKVALHGNGEAETLGKLKHPNIVPVYSIQEDAKTGLTAICMPFMGRCTLSDILDNAFSNKQLPKNSRIIADTIRDLNDDADLLELSSFDSILLDGMYVEGIIHLAIKIAEALEYTHSCGISHGDLKPSNVLLSMDGRPLLLDFNLSVDGHFQSSKIGGTLPYMAPEQLELVVHDNLDESVRADPKTDIFSLGVVLYQLLSGELPFGPISWDSPIEQVAEQLLKEQTKGPCSLRKKNKHVDKRLAQVIHACLAYSPEQRPKSASELIKAFRKELSPFRRTIRWCHNHRRLVGSMASIMSMIILLVASFFIFRPAYSVRQYQNGLQLFDKGKFDLAIEHFGNSLQADANQSEVFFARGRAYERGDNYLLAYEDFKKSMRLSPKGETNACMGYCAHKLKYPNEAIILYQRALSTGYPSPLVLNNLGFCYFTLSQLDEAKECLEIALMADDNIQSAHHILVGVSLNKAFNGDPLSDEAFEHALKAIALGPPSADLYYNIALIYVLAAQENPEMKRPALVCLERAIDYGLNPKKILTTPTFDPLREEQQFKALISKKPGKEPPLKPEYIVDPLGRS
jgi:eukaryotic-like serine/threonine-protein kinase